MDVARMNAETTNIGRMMMFNLKDARIDTYRTLIRDIQDKAPRTATGKLPHVCVEHGPSLEPKPVMQV